MYLCVIILPGLWDGTHGERKVVETRRSRKIFVGYAQDDRQWLERLLVHVAPLEREEIIELWSDRKVSTGTFWKQQIQEAIESSQAAIILVSAHFLASKFIARYELPRLLKQARTGGTRIFLVIVSYSLFEDTPLGQFQAVNSPDRPLVAMGVAEREQTLMKFAYELYRY